MKSALFESKNMTHCDVSESNAECQSVIKRSGDLTVHRRALYYVPDINNHIAYTLRMILTHKQSTNEDMYVDSMYPARVFCFTFLRLF